MALGVGQPLGVDPLPFVNWIFWGALAGGTLFAVGLTQWLGGTTGRLPAVHGGDGGRSAPASGCCRS